MVIIVKRLVPVYNPSDKVPRSWLNLRKAVHVASFKQLYPNIATILVEEYGLHPEEKIVVFWTKEIALPQFARYRVNFRKVYAGPLSAFARYAGGVRGERRWQKENENKKKKEED